MLDGRGAVDRLEDADEVVVGADAVGAVAGAGGDAVVVDGVVEVSGKPVPLDVAPVVAVPVSVLLDVVVTVEADVPPDPVVVAVLVVSVLVELVPVVSVPVVSVPVVSVPVVSVPVVLVVEPVVVEVDSVDDVLWSSPSQVGAPSASA